MCSANDGTFGKANYTMDSKKELFMPVFFSIYPELQIKARHAVKVPFSETKKGFPPNYTSIWWNFSLLVYNIDFVENINHSFTILKISSKLLVAKHRMSEQGRERLLLEFDNLGHKGREGLKTNEICMW